MEYPTGRLHFLRIHTRLNARVYTEKIQVTRGIFHSMYSVYLSDQEVASTEYTLFLKKKEKKKRVYSVEATSKKKETFY